MDHKVFDAERGLSISPGGTIYSRPAVDEEDQRFLDQQWEDYMRSTMGDLEEDETNNIVHERRTMETHLNDWEAAENNVGDDDDDGDEAVVGGKRTVEASGPLRCYYIGCRKDMTGYTPLYCPPATGTGPDFPDPFHDWKCAAAFACYEIGDPFADGMVAMIEQRAGGRVDPAPIPADTLAFQMGGLMTHDDAMQLTPEELKSRGNVDRADRRKGHKKFAP